MLQAAVAGPTIPKPRAPAPRCGSTGPDGALIVCGQGQEQFRLPKLDDRYRADAPAIPKAETSILGGRATLAAELEQGADAQGGKIDRAMVRLKLPF